VIFSIFSHELLSCCIEHPAFFTHQYPFTFSSGHTFNILMLIDPRCFSVLQLLHWCLTDHPDPCYPEIITVNITVIQPASVVMRMIRSFEWSGRNRVSAGNCGSCRSIDGKKNWLHNIIRPAIGSKEFSVNHDINSLFCFMVYKCYLRCSGTAGY